jgi:hypothetical protein
MKMVAIIEAFTKFSNAPGKCTFEEVESVKRFLLKYLECRDIYKESTGTNPVGMTIESTIKNLEDRLVSLKRQAKKQGPIDVLSVQVTAISKKLELLKLDAAITGIIELAIQELGTIEKLLDKHEEENITVGNTIGAITDTFETFIEVMDIPSLSITADNNTLFCPMLDARRMEVYNAIYDINGKTVKEISAKIIKEDSFMNIPESKKIIFFGDGAAKCKEMIKRTNIHFADEFVISAAHMHIPAINALKDHHFEDVAYFEPFYLKDFITTKSKKNIFGK